MEEIVLGSKIVLGLKAILHYALGLRFRNLKCSKTLEKKLPKRSRFYPMHSVI